MDERIRGIITQSDSLFEKKKQLNQLHQEIADHFYPERADFTVHRTLGAEFADHLFTSIPILARRELGNAFSAMLRPTAKQWFHVKTMREDRVDEPGRRWLEWAEGTMRRAIYDPASQFVRATKEGDHDFAAFGQAVLSIELNKRADGLLFRCWHNRDCAFLENAEGKIATLHRKWHPSARELHQLFNGKVSSKVRDLVEKKKGNELTEIKVRHIVMPSEDYDEGPGKLRKFPYVSLMIDVENDGFVMEEVGLRHFKYVVPRWQTVSGSQYAFSPATVAALADARTIQAMARTLLEAGEKAVAPPMIAVDTMIRSDVQLFAGGITWVDSEYDERTGEVLRPLTQDFRGMPHGLEMMKEARSVLEACFFLNKLQPLPQTDDKEKTAFETGQIMQNYIREALPLFEPMEMDYNGGLCNLTFELMKDAGGFGAASNMPRSIAGSEVQFRFESPLNDLIEAQLGQKLGETKALIAQVVDLDPASASMVDAKVALRDALRGIGTPAKWLRTPQEMQDSAQQAADAQKTQALLGTLQQGANLAKTAGEAAQSIGAAGGQDVSQSPTTVRVAA
jgi:hypothetical protein